MKFYDWLEGGGLYAPEGMELPIFASADQLQPCAPIYSYPFMTAPMASDEYYEVIERNCLVPLDEDYDGSDDDSGGDDDPSDPNGPLRELAMDGPRFRNV